MRRETKKKIVSSNITCDDQSSEIKCNESFCIEIRDWELHRILTGVQKQSFFFADQKEILQIILELFQSFMS
jgi:hypothetical protein